jgi:hypothetical protein
MKLLSALGTNYKIINGQIQYVPGQGTRDNSNPMQQFSTNQGDLMKYIQSGLNSSDPKERSTALEMYGKIFGVK